MYVCEAVIPNPGSGVLASGRALVVTAGGRACALRLAEVIETMRPLPIEPVAGARGFLLGVATIRGDATPVVDLAAVLDPRSGGGPIGRLVTIRAGSRQVALAVAAVVGLCDLEAAPLAALPPLLREASADAIEAIGTADAQLLVVLRAARLIPDDVWTMIGHSKP